MGQRKEKGLAAEKSLGLGQKEADKRTGEKEMNSEAYSEDRIPNS